MSPVDWLLWVRRSTYVVACTRISLNRPAKTMESGRQGWALIRGLSCVQICALFTRLRRLPVSKIMRLRWPWRVRSELLAGWSWSHTEALLTGGLWCSLEDIWWYRLQPQGDLAGGLQAQQSCKITSMYLNYQKWSVFSVEGTSGNAGGVLWRIWNWQLGKENAVQKLSFSPAPIK